MVSMCCNFSVTCMRYSIIRAQKYSKILEKPRKDHSLTFVIKMILLVYSYMFNYQIFKRFVRVTVLLINDHKKSDKFLAGSCHTHEFVLLGNVFIAMEGNARFDVLEGCSAHHFVKLPPAIFLAQRSESDCGNLVGHKTWRRSFGCRWSALLQRNCWAYCAR